MCGKTHRYGNIVIQEQILQTFSSLETESSVGRGQRGGIQQGQAGGRGIGWESGNGEVQARAFTVVSQEGSGQAR